MHDQFNFHARPKVVMKCHGMYYTGAIQGALFQFLPRADK